jgi:molecular chaperone GrpE (heat shock protein)
MILASGTVSRAERAGLLAFTARFPETDNVSGATNWKIPKWPFLLGDALLLGFAFYIIWSSPHPVAQWEIIACLAAAAVGAMIGIAPFILDHRAVLRLVEVNALGEVAGKIQELERLADQINAATSEWTNVQTQAEKISTGAKEIAGRMEEEVRQFSEFMQKMSDSEKAALRLEAEKLHRGEAEWLQVLVRILDHIFALHAAAAHSNQPQVTEQITHFQNACRGVARRVGVTPFTAEPGEPFNPDRHQAMDAKSKPPPDAAVAKTVGLGYTFQGRLLRPALVRLKEDGAGRSDETELPLEATEST